MQLDAGAADGRSGSRQRVTFWHGVRAFLRLGTCSEAVMNVVDRGLGRPLEREESATVPLAGGMMQHGYQCGMLWGATLAAGAEAFGRFGAGPLAETRAIQAAQRVVASFRTQAKSINCFEITELDWVHARRGQILRFIARGGPVGCFRMAGRYGRMAFREIEASMAESQTDVPEAPVSCAALVARKLGASEMHAVMAAGCAGGLGLCGGACGALGAAVWMAGMPDGPARPKKLSVEYPRQRALVERLLKTTDYELECSKITGRLFESVSDHAAYLREDGCARVIETLATSGA